MAEKPSHDTARHDPVVHDSASHNPALDDPAAGPEAAPVDFWEERYSGSDRVWSGRVNQVLSSVADALVPGHSLDLGCGEGADVIWLALHGWRATGIDISPTAISRAKTVAAQAGLSEDSARFKVADLATIPLGAYDLVSASFFHSPVDLPRENILRNAAECVAPGGHLLITSHADVPSGAEVLHEKNQRDRDHPYENHHDHRFLSPAEELAQLDLDPQEWNVVLAETRAREMVMPSGEPATREDVVVLVRRGTPSETKVP